jgi:predicted nucleic acid-binding protein
MDYVLDASLAVRWCLPDEATRGPLFLMETAFSKQVANVPDIWAVEVRNGLLTAERRKRISRPAVEQFLLDISRIPTRIHPAVAELKTAMALSRKYQMPLYDAIYISIAARLGLPLATLDIAQAQAAKAEQIALIL